MRTHILVPYTPLQQEGFFQVERPLESQAMRFYAVRPALQTPCAIAAQPASCARPRGLASASATACFSSVLVLRHALDQLCSYIAHLLVYSYIPDLQVALGLRVLQVDI